MGPVPHQLTAKIKGSFAYLTVKDRLPVILTKVLDHLCREKDSICEEYGEEVAEEIKDIVGQLSQLKNEMQTNKPFLTFNNSESSITNDDSEVWNQSIHLYKTKFGEEPKWYTASWLFAECYMYKRIHYIFAGSKSLKSYDPFYHQKVQACKSAAENINLLCDFVVKSVSSSNHTFESKKKIVLEMVEMSLWGNQCDLSISGGEEISQKNSALMRLEEMRANLVVSHSEQFWQYLSTLPEGKKEMALILDNAGLELVADLCFATVLTEYEFVSSVVLYPKSRPWFVSDTTLSDLNWTLNYMRDQGDHTAELSEKISSYLEKGVWKIKENPFWTGPYEFSQMKSEDPVLYKELSRFGILIFKGDLNYRKLVGDLDWPNHTSFKKALRGFLPSPILALRTIKGGPVVGLDESSSNVIKAKTKENWSTSGEFGMIQFLQEGNFWLRNAGALAAITTCLFALLMSFIWNRI